ncbi:multiple monosaccharide ABC transporter substrate-binding protein [Microbacterium sp. RD1]|uniref:multiple monosaccharide ABC transporter substrate-binding protein n=1 Tax=Microbacterium sp. RD1 TaxID=3457313 RepID=UPI003FA5B856
MLSACSAGGGSGGEGGGDGGLIGVAMPTKSSERWIQDGNAVKETLEEQGFSVDLQYAEDDIPTQVSQIENMITKGAEALIIASIDGTTLSEVLQTAADADIPVIAYDRLIKGSENVDYYATFDNFLVGQQQAWTLLNGLGLTDLEGNPLPDAPAGPFNIELFAGSLDDNNAFFFFDGAMDVLQPLIDDGTLVVKSGQTDIEQAATLRWDGETAQSRMEDLLTANYSDGSKVNAVLSPYDGISRGIISALTDAGYTVGDEWPTISGQDAEVDSVKAILSGEQYATIFKDTRELAKVAADMAVAVLNGEEPEVNDEETYDNDVKIVPSYLLAPVPVVTDNVEAVLVDSGYWTAEELGL